MTKIDPRVIKTLRKHNRLTQGQLAEKLGVSKRQVAEWEREREGTPPVGIREDNVEKLGRLFRVTREQLAGQEPLTPSPHDDARKQQFTGRLTQQSRLNYELIDWRYGVSRDELIEAAPMLFALLARQSLAWREEQLERLRTAIELLQDADEAFVPSEVVEDYLEFTTRALENEEEALSREDIFTPSIPDLDHQLHFCNRFADYLLEVAQTVDVTFDLGGPMSMFPDHLVFPSTLEQICGGPDAPQKARAAYALASGSIRLSQIPAEFRDDVNREERAEWLAGMAPELPDDLEYSFEIGSIPVMFFKEDSTAS